jgi:hypothetical protein
VELSLGFFLSTGEQYPILLLANVIGSVGYSLEYTPHGNFCGVICRICEKDFLTGLLNRRAFTERASSIGA